MNNDLTSPFSKELYHKIETLKKRRPPVKLGRVNFCSPLLLAPMSMICKAPFRRLMEDLGAGGSASELISCHGINYKNEKTLNMLKINPKEKCVGIQLFGEDGPKMAQATEIAIDQQRQPDFIDINMGCPVKKVVSKGGGSALLRDTKQLSRFFATINKPLYKAGIPLTIKIRTGWDDQTRNADEVIRIAKEEGVEFVAIHGRTRTQQYKGHADWDYLEHLNQQAPLPLIGNGDLNTPKQVQQRLKQTRCQALMLGRGPLRNPFLFLEAFLTEDELAKGPYFSTLDHLEVLKALSFYIEQHAEWTKEELNPRHHLIQLRKHIIWLAAGFKGAGPFRDQVFKTSSLEETFQVCEDFFGSLAFGQKQLDPNETFMTSGHG